MRTLKLFSVIVFLTLPVLASATEFQNSEPQTTIQIEVQEDGEHAILKKCENDFCHDFLPDSIPLSKLDETIKALKKSGIIRKTALIGISVLGAGAGTAAGFITMIGAAHHHFSGKLALFLSGAFLVAIPSFVSESAMAMYLGWGLIAGYWGTITYYLSRHFDFLDPRIPYEQAELLQKIQSQEPVVVTPEELAYLAETLKSLE